MAFRGHGKLADSWWGSTTPSTTPSGTTNTYVGVGMEFDVPGRVAGFRIWRPAASTSAGFAMLWTAGHELLTAHHFHDASLAADGWQQLWFNPWVRIDTTVWYWLGVYVRGGGWKRTNSALTGDVVHNNIRFKKSFQSTSIDVVNISLTENTNANGVDVLFHPD